MTALYLTANRTPFNTPQPAQPSCQQPHLLCAAGAGLIRNCAGAVSRELLARQQQQGELLLLCVERRTCCRVDSSAGVAGCMQPCSHAAMQQQQQQVVSGQHEKLSVLFGGRSTPRHSPNPPAPGGGGGEHRHLQAHRSCVSRQPSGHGQRLHGGTRHSAFSPTPGWH